MTILATSVEWLSKQTGRNLWLTPDVLTYLNKDDHTAPKMTPVEAQGVFRYLIDKKLIFPWVDSTGKTVFLLNEVEDQRWKDTLADLKKPSWRQSRGLKRLGIGMLWFISLILSGFIGAGLQEAGKDFYRYYFPEDEENIRLVGKADNAGLSAAIDAGLDAREAAYVAQLYPRMKEIYSELLLNYRAPDIPPKTFAELFEPAAQLLTAIGATNESPRSGRTDAGQGSGGDR